MLSVKYKSYIKFCVSSSMLSVKYKSYIQLCVSSVMLSVKYKSYILKLFIPCMPSDDDFFNTLKKKQQLNITYEKLQNKRYFHLKHNDNYNYCRNRLEKSEQNFRELLEKDFKSANFQSKESFLTYGIIFVTEEKDIYIFNSINDSNCTPVKLNFEFCKRFSIFHGQLVVIKGKNCGNNELFVENIHCLPFLDHVQTKNNFNCCLKIITDYSENINLRYDVIICIGCDIPDKLKKLQKDTIFISIPTLEDQNTVQVYPMNSKNTSKDNFLSFGNPCTFNIENVKFCVNTFKVIDFLDENEISKNEGSNKNDPCGDLLFADDKIMRLCYHLVFQRSFLPVLDIKNVSYDSERLNMFQTPDFYIIRSDLFDPFCKDVGPTKIINIGSKYNWEIIIKEKVTEMNLSIES